jgi:hypothetical protein
MLLILGNYFSKRMNITKSYSKQAYAKVTFRNETPPKVALIA